VSANDESKILVAEIVQEQLAEIGIRIIIRELSDLDIARYIEYRNYELILTRKYEITISRFK